MNCEICGISVNSPSDLDANHTTPQSEIRQWRKRLKENISQTEKAILKEKIKRANRNVNSLCPNCHRKVTNGKIVILGYRQSTAGKLIEWFYSDEPEDIRYGSDIF
jgi:hypothetical protein